jgi:hypothetical protein
VEEAAEQVLTEITLGDLEGGRVRLRRRPRRPQSYTGVTIFVALVIIVLGWIIISQVTKDDPPPVNAQPGPQDVRGGGRGGGKNIFDFPEDQKPRSDGGGAAPMPAGQVPVAAAKEDDPVRARLNAAAPEDPRKQTDEWKAVVEANSGSERPGKALWTIVDYRRLHPGQFEEELKQYEEAAFDRLWWERIKELMELRESLAMEIDKKNIEIAQETEVGFKERLVKERERLEERRKGVGEVLVAEMGYQGREVPNLFDSGQIAKLRAQRIAETYEGWKRRVTSSLQRTRNLPWERTR